MPLVQGLASRCRQGVVVLKYVVAGYVAPLLGTRVGFHTRLEKNKSDFCASLSCRGMRERKPELEKLDDNRRALGMSNLYAITTYKSASK